MHSIFYRVLPVVEPRVLLETSRGKSLAPKVASIIDKPNDDPITRDELLAIKRITKHRVIGIESTPGEVHLVPPEKAEATFDQFFEPKWSMGGVNPAGWITPPPDYQFVHIGYLKLFKDKKGWLELALTGKRPKIVSAQLNATLEAHPELFGPTNLPFKRFLENHVAIFRTLLTATSSRLTSTAKEYVEILDEIEEEGIDMRCPFLPLISRKMLIGSRGNSFLPGVKTFTDILRQSIGYQHPDVFDINDVEAHDAIAAEINLLYVLAASEVDKNIIPKKKGVLNNQVGNTRSPYSARCVLVTKHYEDYEEMSLADSALFIQWATLVAGIVKREMDKQSSYLSFTDALLYVKENVHTPTELMYQALEEIIALYVKETGKGAPFITIRWPSTRPSNINVYYLKKIRRNPIDQTIGLPVLGLTLINGDVDGDELGISSIPLAVAKSFGENETNLSIKQHHQDVTVTTRPKLTGFDVNSLVGLDYYMCSEQKGTKLVGKLTIDDLVYDEKGATHGHL